MTQERGGVRWLAYAALFALGACGQPSHTAPTDAGVDGPLQLTLSVSIAPPVLAGLVITHGELELERLGLFGNDGYDSRSEVPRVDLAFDAAVQQFAFPDAGFSLYSRVRAEVDHLLIQGTWNNTPLLINTEEDERIVDLRGPDQELSPTQPASFGLKIDGARWLDADALNAVPVVNGVIQLDVAHNPALLDALVGKLVASFLLQ